MTCSSPGMSLDTNNNEKIKMYMHRYKAYQQTTPLHLASRFNIFTTTNLPFISNNLLRSYKYSSIISNCMPKLIYTCNIVIFMASTVIDLFAEPLSRWFGLTVHIRWRFFGRTTFPVSIMQDLAIFTSAMFVVLLAYTKDF